MLLLPDDIPVYGDQSFRGRCPIEAVELASFFSRLRREFPESWGLIALHPRNEQLLSRGQFSTVLQHKAEGMTSGAADIIIPAARSFVCELKRTDHTKCTWQDGQQEYLRIVSSGGGFACIGLGAVGAWAAFQDWMQTATMS